VYREQEPAVFTIEISRETASKVAEFQLLPRKTKNSGKRSSTHPLAERSSTHPLAVTKDDIYGGLSKEVFRNPDVVDLHAKSFRTHSDLCSAVHLEITECKCLACLRKLPHTPIEAVKPVSASTACESKYNSTTRKPSFAGAGSLDGLWINAEGSRVATIHEDIVCFENGPTSKMERPNDGNISIILPDYGTLDATYTAGKLVWNDGDEWVWAGPHQNDDSKCLVESERVPEDTHDAAQNRAKVDSHTRSLRARIGGGGGAASDSTSLPPERKTRGLPDPNVFPGAGGGSFFWSSDGVGRGIEFPTHIGGSTTSALAQSWVSYWGGKRNVPVDGEEPRVRVILTDSYPRVFLFELNSPRTTNMLDTEMVADGSMAFEAILDIMQRHNGRNTYGPMSYVFQGVGPHFCPGGNPNTYPGGLPDGVNRWGMSSYALALNAMNWNKLGIPGVTCLHGASVGGGAAQTLNTTFRSMEHRASVSFGNLSRGMCPIMLLSKHIPAINYAGAIAYYLTDDTWAPTALFQCGYCRQVVKGNSESKQEGLRFAKRLATSARATVLSSMRPALDMYEQFAMEGIGLDRAASDTQSAFNINKESTNRSLTKTKALPKIEADPDIKVKKNELINEDSAVLKLEVPTGKTVLEMKQKISSAWNLSMDDFTLMNGDKELKDSDIVPEKAKNGSIKLVMKESDDTEYGDDYDYDDDDWGEGDYEYDEE